MRRDRPARRGTTRPPRARSRRPAGRPRATASAGGSMTVSDARSIPGRREQRDDAAVGVPDEVVARPELRPEPLCVLGEVDAVGRRAGREARPVHDDELPSLGERALARPGRVAVRDAPVDEDDARHSGTLAPHHQRESGVTSCGMLPAWWSPSVRRSASPAPERYSWDSPERASWWARSSAGRSATGPSAPPSAWSWAYPWESR